VKCTLIQALRTKFQYLAFANSKPIAPLNDGPHSQNIKANYPMAKARAFFWKVHGRTKTWLSCRISYVKMEYTMGETGATKINDRYY
jgi:hypothetical protein